MPSGKLRRKQRFMTLKQYLFVMILGTAVALATAATILFFTDPEESGVMAPVMLLLTAGLGVVGLLSVLGVVARVYILRRSGLIVDQVKTAFRQSFLVALLLIASLILSHFELLTWWLILVLVAILGVLEYLFISAENRSADNRGQVLDSDSYVQ